MGRWKGCESCRQARRKAELGYGETAGMETYLLMPVASVVIYSKVLHSAPVRPTEPNLNMYRTFMTMVSDPMPTPRRPGGACDEPRSADDAGALISYLLLSCGRAL